MENSILLSNYHNYNNGINKQRIVREDMRWEENEKNTWKVYVTPYRH